MTNELSPRIVKPKDTTYARLPVMAYCDGILLDEDGQITTFNELVNRLPTLQSTIFSMQGSPDFLAALDGAFAPIYPTTWQWRTSDYERDIVNGKGEIVKTSVTVSIHYFGWKNSNFHRVIDPVTMYLKNIDEIWLGDNNRIEKLLQWGIQLRNFCDANHIQIRPTMGGIASQFLTDPRFYSQPRRKVPAATNKAVREHLPGNYYSLTVKATPSEDWTAHYLDQRRAHHYHARNIAFPDANTLFAYGDFVTLSNVVFPEPWKEFMGLYCLDLYSPAHRLPFDWSGQAIVGKRHRILTKQFVYSNELPHLLDSGYRVIGVRAAWGGINREAGLNIYAIWANKQLNLYRDAPWLKPLLLSTYGVLACKPKQAESIFRLARGERVTFRTGRNTLTGHRTRAPRKLEPRIANVLHRGMIEAATRSESVGMAQWLTGLGHRILSIYADAVIVEHDDQLTLPSLPLPWRYKTPLTHLQYINQQAFISGEMTKLPGVGRNILKYDLRPPRPGNIDVALEMELSEPIQQ